MIKNILKCTALLGIVASTLQCQQQPKSANNQTSADSLSSEVISQTDTALVAEIRVQDSYKLSDSLSVVFVVNNPTTDTLRYTQYHTPFEGLFSQFLTITDAEGNEVAYVGPMAKRMMPPPEDTYHTLAPGQQDSVRFALKKVYKIEKAGTYTLQYNSENISGIANGKPVTLSIIE